MQILWITAITNKLQSIATKSMYFTKYTYVWNEKNSALSISVALYLWTYIISMVLCNGLFAGCKSTPTLHCKLLHTREILCIHIVSTLYPLVAWFSTTTLKDLGQILYYKHCSTKFSTRRRNGSLVIVLLTIVQGHPNREIMHVVWEESKK